MCWPLASPNLSLLFSSYVVSDSLHPHRLQACLSFTISQSLLKVMSIESMMPYNHLIFCCSLLLPSVFPRIRIFSNESALCITWPKYWSFSISVSPSNEYSGLISLGIDLFDLFSFLIHKLRIITSALESFWKHKT